MSGLQRYTAAMLLRTLSLSVALLSSLSLAGCAVEAGDGGAAESSEQALTSLATGTFAIESKPLSGSYVARLTLSAGKKFEMEYVRRTTTSEPWVFNPWLSVPVTHEEAIVLRGTYFLYNGDPGKTMVSLDVTDGTESGLHYLFEVATAPGALKLTTIDHHTFELKATSAPSDATDKRVLHCDGYQITAVITLDEVQRRRGTIAIKRKANADNLAPPNRTTTVVYTGGTGVDDYMAYEGHDSDGNGYEFALRESDLEKTSGPTSNVGLGYSPNDIWSSGAAYHNSLTCTVGTR